VQQLEGVFVEQETKLTSDEKVSKAVSDAVFLVSFYIRDTRFATRIDRVREVVEDAVVTPLPVSNDVYSGVINLRGNLIPVLAASRLVKSGSDHSLKDITEDRPRRFIVFETQQKDAFAVEATGVHKVECPESEVRDLGDKFSEVIRIDGTPTQLLNFCGADANKVLSAEEREK
jgi:chemotaxis signal transduction protein